MDRCSPSHLILNSDSGRHRERERETGHLRVSGQSVPGGCDFGIEHVVDSHHAHRVVDRAAVSSLRNAFYESGADHEIGGGDSLNHFGTTHGRYRCVFGRGHGQRDELKVCCMIGAKVSMFRNKSVFKSDCSFMSTHFRPWWFVVCFQQNEKVETLPGSLRTVF